MKLSACVDMMFSDLDFYDRFRAAKQCGMDAAEFWAWGKKDVDRICRELERNDLSLSVFNIDSRNEDISRRLARGILNTGAVEDFLYALRESIPVYHTLKASAMIVLIGDVLPNVNKRKQEENILECLQAAAAVAEENGVTLVVELLNGIDRQGYFMTESRRLLSILNAVDSPNVKMLYDIYHQHMTDDFSLDVIRENIHRIGHFHVADCPGRHEPGTGNVDYVTILRNINKMNYDGYVGLEYRATKPEKETLDFLKEV